MNRIRRSYPIRRAAGIIAALAGLAGHLDYFAEITSLHAVNDDHTQLGGEH